MIQPNIQFNFFEVLIIVIR